MSDVRMPDGTIIRNVPDGITRTQLMERLEKSKQKPRSEQNFFERFGDDLNKNFRGEGAAIIKRIIEDDQGFQSASLQAVGKIGAKSILDFMGEALVSGGRGLSKITPDFIEDPIKENATKAGLALLNTDVGQEGLEAARKGIAEYSAFKQKNPVMAANIEAMVDVGLLVAPVKGKPKVPKPGVLTKAGVRLEKSAARSMKKNRKAFVDDLVTPSQTKRVREAQVGRTTIEGPLRSKRVELSPSQKASASEVLKVRGVSPKNTIQGNWNAIRDEVTREADKLMRGLKRLEQPSARSSVSSRGRYVQKELDDALDVMAAKAAHPSVQGDAAKATADMIEGMKRIAAQNPKTLSGLMKSRREFDQWITQGKGPNFWNSDVGNAIQIGVRDTRREVNNFIAARAPGKGVNRSLRKQHRLLNAMDDIRVKAAAEENNMLSRAFKNALKLLPFRGEFNQFMAALFGVGGLGASARFAPLFTKLVGATGVAYVGGKAIIHPGSRKGLAGLLKMIDDAMQKTTDPAVLRQFRADRAAIVELMNTSVEAVEEDK